jgi:ABC-type molybdate transport system ATPase subunit
MEIKMLNSKIESIQNEIKLAIDNLEVHINLYTPQQVTIYNLAKDVIHKLEELKEEVQVPQTKCKSEAELT